jgi:hypothetical protein
VDGFNSIKLGFNSADISFPKTTMKLKTNSGKELEWLKCGYRCEKLVSTSRIVDYYGELLITDVTSGMQLKANIKMGLAVSGVITNASGTTTHKFTGNMLKGLTLTGADTLKVAPISHKQVIYMHSPEVLADPLVTLL